MSDSQVPIDYKINEVGLFSAFNSRLQAIDTSLSLLLVKSLRRQGENVVNDDGFKSHSQFLNQTNVYSQGSSPQDTRMRSSSFSGRPSSRSSSSSSASAVSMPLSFPPDLHNSTSSMSFHPPHPDTLSSFSDPCLFGHDDASSTSPSVRAREDLHYQRYHNMVPHHYPTYPSQTPPPYTPPPVSHEYYVPTYNTKYLTPPPPPLPPVHYFLPQVAEEPEMEQEKILQQQQQNIQLDHSQGLKWQEDFNQEQWTGQEVNYGEMQGADPEEFGFGQQDHQDIQIEPQQIQELQIEDLLQPEDLQQRLGVAVVQQQHQQHIDITEQQTTPTTQEAQDDAATLIEASENPENPQKSQNSENNPEKQQQPQPHDKTPAKPQYARHMSKWIRAEESSDDSNDDVVLPKDLPPPPVSPSVSPHQLTKPSPNSSEKLYQDFVSDLTGRMSITSASILSSSKHKLRTSSSTSSLNIAPSRLSYRSSSSSSKEKISKQPLTRSLPPTSSASSPIPSLSSSPIPPDDSRHMSRSLSNLEWRTHVTRRSVEPTPVSRQVRSRSDADDDELLREELRQLNESLRSLDRSRVRPETRESRDRYSNTSRTLSRSLENEDELDAIYTRSTAPTSARPPPSPVHRTSNLDDSMREELRQLTDNLREVEEPVTQSRRMSDMDQYSLVRQSADAALPSRSMRLSTELHDMQTRDTYMRSSLRTSSEITPAYSRSSLRMSDEVHDTRAHEGAYAVHSSLASEHALEPPRRVEVQRRNTSEGAVPLEQANNLDGSFVIPLSYNEYISVLAKRYQDKASHITKPSVVLNSTLISNTTTTSSASKKVVPKKKKGSAGDVRKSTADSRDLADRRKSRSTEWS